MAAADAGTSAYFQSVAMGDLPCHRVGKICAPGETLFLRKHCVRCRVALGLSELGTEGETLRQLKQTLLTCFEVVAYSALLLLLPSVVAGLVFDWIVTEILAQIILVAVAGTACLTAMAIHEGWYFDHLSGWGLTRNHVEPSFTAKPPSVQAADGREARSG
jgi:hypothetical protein